MRMKRNKTAEKKERRGIKIIRKKQTENLYAPSSDRHRVLLGAFIRQTARYIQNVY